MTQAAKTEAPAQANSRLEASRIGARLFRNNRGLFKTIDGKRHVRAGLEAEGASDLVGDYPVTVTPEMVGMTLAVALYVEVKEPKWKKPGDEREKQQAQFIDSANARGAIAFFLTDHKSLKSLAEKAVKNMVDRFKRNV